MRMVLSAVRNDYRAAETYVCATDHRLRSPVTALSLIRERLAQPAAAPR